MPHPTLSPQRPTGVSEIRFLPVMHVQTGETHTLFAETDKRFEERAVFGRAAKVTEGGFGGSLSPATWLAEQIEAVAADAHSQTTQRPIIVSAPLAALVHPDLAMACDAAIRRTNLCAQEISIEICDASLANSAPEPRRSLEALRRCGFRISINATRSWQAPLNTALRLLVDTLRIDAQKLDYETELQDRVEAALASGIEVIAENAAWRDGDYLASLGIDYCLRPRLDA